MGRRKTKGNRSPSGRLSRSKLSLVERNPPSDRILARRALFSFAETAKGGNIDQDVCDGIGQLHALGMFDGHPFDGQDMRDKGREWRDHYLRLMKPQGFKMGNYERSDKSHGDPPMTKADYRFDFVDSALVGLERSALYALLIFPEQGSSATCGEHAPWVQACIDEGLAGRGKFRPDSVIRTPDEWERSYLAAAIRGLLLLVDGALPNRREQAAA